MFLFIPLLNNKHKWHAQHHHIPSTFASSFALYSWLLMASSTPYPDNVTLSSFVFYKQFQIDSIKYNNNHYKHLKYHNRHCKKKIKIYKPAGSDVECTWHRPIRQAIEECCATAGTPRYQLQHRERRWHDHHSIQGICGQISMFFYSTWNLMHFE